MAHSLSSLPFSCAAMSMRSIDTRARQRVGHVASHHLLLYFTQANVMLSLGERMLSLVDDSIVLVAPGTAYSFAYGSRCAYYSLAFGAEDEEGRAILHTMLEKRSPLLHIKDKARQSGFHLQLEQLYGHLQRAPLDDLGAYSALYTQALLTKLVLDVFALQASAQQRPALDPRRQLAERIAAYLDDNLLSPITLEQLERAFFLSRFHLCRLFREQMQMTLFDYIRLKKVRLAMKMLRDTGLSIADICYECGFGNVQSFYNAFKRHAKKTPLEYRKESRMEE